MKDLSYIEFTPAVYRGETGGLGGQQQSAARPTQSSRSRAGGAADSEAKSVLARLFDHFALDILAYRFNVLERRVPALWRRLRVHSWSAARSALSQRPELRAAALEAVLIGVTDWFRDPAVFDYLRRFALAELLARRPNLRVLSAGCSNGSELYSFAVLLAEAGALQRAELLGIDCRPDAIWGARAAAYCADALQRMDSDLRARCFLRDGRQFRLRPNLAASVQFEIADLLTFRGAQRWDVILFRNVAIYLAGPAADRAWQHLAAQLNPGGLLVCGKAEQPPASLGFERLAPCVYRQPLPGQPQPTLS